ncbi:MAG: hypothetical protein F4149_19795, partial [Gammaproteobacteria bacterium]|nr:hypothetical protein [Gammaproteobacteria bacterium]
GGGGGGGRRPPVGGVGPVYPPSLPRLPGRGPPPPHPLLPCFQPPFPSACLSGPKCASKRRHCAMASR